MHVYCILCIREIFLTYPICWEGRGLYFSNNLDYRIVSINCSLSFTLLLSHLSHILSFSVFLSKCRYYYIELFQLLCLLVSTYRDLFVSSFVPAAIVKLRFLFPSLKHENNKYIQLVEKENHEHNKDG